MIRALREFALEFSARRIYRRRRRIRHLRFFRRHRLWRRRRRGRFRRIGRMHRQVRALNFPFRATAGGKVWVVIKIIKMTRDANQKDRCANRRQPESARAFSSFQTRRKLGAMWHSRQSAYSPESLCCLWRGSSGSPASNFSMTRPNSAMFSRRFFARLKSCLNRPECLTPAGKVHESARARKALLASG